MSTSTTSLRRSAWRWVPALLTLIVIGVLAAGTLRNPQFWFTAGQRGDRLMRAGRYSDAAKVYADPARIGAALYRAGEFKAAAATFARVPGAEGLFNRGNAQLMQGEYDGAIARYDQALALRPDWKDAADNRALAVARRDKLRVDDETREAEQAEDAYTPDKVVVDNRAGDRDKPPAAVGAPTESDEALQAAWLRRVQTTPGDFLRAKFAYQAAQATVEGEP